jgi:hypothetical protein
LSRIAAALNSSDLSHQRDDREPGIVDVDIVRSLGLTAIRRSLGVALLECRNTCAGDSPHDVARIKELTKMVQSVVQRHAMREGVRVSFKGVAAQVVKELILDRCQTCQGRGVLPMRYDGSGFVIDGTERGESSKDADCPTCLGSGRPRRDAEGRARAAGWDSYTRELGEWWERLYSRLCDAEMVAMRHAKNRLR